MARATRLLVLAFAALLCPSGLLQADDAEPDPDEPPLVGRPEHFSGLVGSYQLAATAAPVELAVEDPLVLTVRVNGSAPARHPPQRPALRLLAPGLDQDFHIRDLAEKDRYLEATKTWEFLYQLRPKRPEVEKVPALALAYFDPTFRRYQTSYSEAIPLTVKPRPQAQPPAAAVAAGQAAEGTYELVTGETVLRRVGTGWPGWPLLVLLALGPPAVCAGWYVVWRHRHPATSWLHKQRRSQAARHALQRLQTLDGAGGGQLAAVLAEYLRQRLDLPTAEPTPREAAGHVYRLGLSSPLARQVADFLRVCDAARFAPGSPPGQADLAGEARTLILALESESCFPPRS